MEGLGEGRKNGRSGELRGGNELPNWSFMGVIKTEDEVPVMYLSV
jgi:hypothetical protein